jgi:diacylglycerol O-acyltransferase
MESRTTMSTQDALWLTMDRPNNLMLIDGVMLLSENPGMDRVREVIKERVRDRFPVFSRRPVREGNGWAWVEDPTFDIDRHLKTVRLKGAADMAALQRFMSEQRAKPLPKTRPLWVMYLVENVHLDDGTVGAAVVSRFHHAIGDGVRLTQLMLSLCDTDEPPAIAARVGRDHIANGDDADAPDAPGDPLSRAAALGASLAKGGVDLALNAGKAVVGGVTGAVGKVVGTAGEVAADPVAAGQATVDAVVHTARGIDTGALSVMSSDRFIDALAALGPDDIRAVNDVTSVTKLLLAPPSVNTVWSGKPGRSKALAWSHPLSLDGVKELGRKQGATVNDVLISAVAGGLRRYLEMHRGDAREVLWMVPVSLKPFDENLPRDLGNYFALVLLPMPLDIDDPRARLQEMHQRMDRIKNSDEAVITFGLQRGISMSPRQVSVFLVNFFANKAVGVLTNVPGPRSPMRFAGVPVLQVIGFAPCSGDQPMTSTIFSYAGTVTVGFATDADLVPDPDVLAGLVVEEVKAMGQEILGRDITATPPAVTPVEHAARAASTRKPTPRKATTRTTATRKATARKGTAGPTTPKAKAPKAG